MTGLRASPHAYAMRKKTKKKEASAAVETHWIDARLADLKALGRKKNKTGLAAAIQEPAARISDIIAGRRRVQPEEAPAMAQYLEWPEPVLWAHVRQRTEDIPDLMPVMVKGEVQAGIWKHVFISDDPEDWGVAPVAAVPAFRQYAQYGLRVRGPSMNELYPDGSVVVCVDLLELGRDPIPGERVVCLRREGDEFEATIKELQRDADGTYLLYPRSTDPNFRHPWRLTASRDFGAETEDIRIVALVVGSYRAEPYASS
jgi:repressor LexA